jgi:hypothetical protein
MEPVPSSQRGSSAALTMEVASLVVGKNEQRKVAPHRLPGEGDESKGGSRGGQDRHPVVGELLAAVTRSHGAARAGMSARPKRRSAIPSAAAPNGAAFARDDSGCGKPTTAGSEVCRRMGGRPRGGQSWRDLRLPSYVWRPRGGQSRRALRLPSYVWRPGGELRALPPSGRTRSRQARPEAADAGVVAEEAALGAPQA